MAIVELLFPVLKTDEASLEEVARNQPLFAKQLTDPNPGLLHAFRGWVLYEDDQHVRDEYKELILLEWQNETSFTSFLGSDQFAGLFALVQPLLVGKPEMQLYETEKSPRDAAAAPIVEVVRVSVTGAENSKAAEEVLKSISGFLTEGGERNIALTYGKSINLDVTTLVGILGWPSSELRSKLSADAIFIESLASLRSFGDVSQLIVDIDALPLPASE